MTVARLLGARHLAQACLSGTRPTPEVIAMGVQVNAVHALTALGSRHSIVAARVLVSSTRQLP
ncbi:hypothetical protein [Solicola sp. PLA-1-18]|uniref:hypothetical protein n=1 Tax=Solicola sp. PLA-1-18 TaxID=3380532 RepID=UPI003B79D8DB